MQTSQHEKEIAIIFSTETDLIDWIVVIKHKAICLFFNN